MEYFALGDLRRRMRGAPHAARGAAACAAAIAHALAAVHAAGVLALDPEARQHHAARRRQHRAHRFRHVQGCRAGARSSTDTGTIFGTPHYMSPGAGARRAVDERSDLYSLGVILFEMLTRREALPRREPDGDRLQAPQGRRSRGCRRSSPRCSRCSSGCWPRHPADRFAERAGSGAHLESTLAAGGCARASAAMNAPGRAPRGGRSILQRADPAGLGGGCRRRLPELAASITPTARRRPPRRALALMFAYPEDRRCASALARLAREELRHFEQVLRAMTRARCALHAATPRTLRRSRAAPRVTRSCRSRAQARSAARRRADRGALGERFQPARAAACRRRWRAAAPGAWAPARPRHFEL